MSARDDEVFWRLVDQLPGATKMMEDGGALTRPVTCSHPDPCEPVIYYESLVPFVLADVARQSRGLRAALAP